MQVAFGEMSRERTERRGLARPEIAARHVTKRFGETLALDDVSLEAGRGEIVVVLGGSGAGKTTLLRLLVALERPTSGSILVGETDLASASEVALNRVRRQMGMVFQYAALLDSLTVLDNVAFPLREHTKLSEREIRERVARQLAELGLPGIEARFPSELSGGMRKRVGLARALMMDPRLLFYDEPTSGLDPLTSRQVDELILRTRDRLGVTSVVISHDMLSAMTIADYVYVLSSGRLAAEGTPRELLAGKSPLATDFLRASGILGPHGGPTPSGA